MKTTKVVGCSKPIRRNEWFSWKLRLDFHKQNRFMELQLMVSVAWHGDADADRIRTRADLHRGVRKTSEALASSLIYDLYITCNPSFLLETFPLL